MIGHDVIWPKILPGPIRGLCVDARPKRGFWSWAIDTNNFAFEVKIILGL